MPLLIIINICKKFILQIFKYTILFYEPLNKSKKFNKYKKMGYGITGNINDNNYNNKRNNILVSRNIDTNNMGNPYSRKQRIYYEKNLNNDHNYISDDLKAKDSIISSNKGDGYIKNNEIESSNPLNISKEVGSDSENNTNEFETFIQKLQI